MVTKQSLEYKDGSYYLTNTVDVNASLELARANREKDNPWFGDKNNECRLMGYIPDEMWTYVPWLMMSRKADREGDKAKAQYYLMKFFDLYPCFAGSNKQRYWRGSRAVIL